MTEIIANLLALFIVFVGLAVIVGDPRLAGRVLGGSAKATVRIVQWVLRQVLGLVCSMLGAGIRSLTRPRQREPRY